MSINRQVKSRFDLTSDIGNSTENNPTADKILTRRSHRKNKHLFATNPWKSINDPDDIEIR
jgi:hypothetical protein